MTDRSSAAKSGRTMTSHCTSLGGMHAALGEIPMRTRDEAVSRTQRLKTTCTGQRQTSYICYQELLV